MASLSGRISRPEVQAQVVPAIDLVLASPSGRLACRFALPQSTGEEEDEASVQTLSVTSEASKRTTGRAFGGVEVNVQTERNVDL